MAQSAEQGNKKPAQVLEDTENVLNRQFGAGDQSKATTPPPAGQARDVQTVVRRSRPRRCPTQGGTNTFASRKSSHMHCKACTMAVEQ